ncbi:MAG: AMP-binding protein [Bacteroidota bacterium]
MTTTIPRYDTLLEYFYHWVDTKPDFPFLKQPYGEKWKTLSYQEAFLEAAKMASALQAAGLEKGDHVAIFSKNCYHWILADLAIMMGGYVSIPLYANLSPAQLAEVLALSDSKLLFVGKLEAWEAHQRALPDDLPIIRFPHYEGNAKVSEGDRWDELTAAHKPQLERFIPDPESLWTIMFTSGTTGTPKGVMHVHKTPPQIVKDDVENDWIKVGRYPGSRFLSYLPLNHVGEKIGIYTNALCIGGTMHFAESLETFAANLQAVQPNIFFAVPRIWNKFYLGVAGKIPLRAQKWLFKLPIISGFLKNSLKKKLGMGDAKIVATGAAITPAYLKNWYKQFGLHLIEAYGMTEVCGSFTNSVDPTSPLDTVGKVVPGCEVKIAPDSGEVLMKSPYMMKGYYKAQELTANVLRDGWLHSGDQGTLDEEGHLRIIGRVSDAFKTSKGKFVTPNPLEETIGDSEYIEQVCVAGLGIPQPIALVNLSEVAGSKNKEAIEEELLTKLKLVNSQVANYEKVSTLVIDQESWTPDNELITPTLKIRRQALNKKHGANFLNWHNSKDTIIWLG